MKRFFYFLALASLSLGSHAQKLSPNTEALLLQTEHHKSRSAVKDVKAYIEINHTSATDSIRRMGGTVYVATQRYLTANLPIAQIRNIAALPQVARVEIASTVTPSMRQARLLGNADIAHTTTNALGQAYRGKDVVVGIVDNGFEYGHAAYYSADGTTFRVKRVWDQNLQSGNTPAAYNYGTEFRSENEMVAQGHDLTNTYHGGHVAGIAAGGDIASSYHGVAPEADLVFVSNGMTNVDITNAVQYIFDYARSVGKPCVINLSLGMHYGPHDGTSTSDNLFSEIVGPGRIIVGAAGNEGTTPLHLSKQFTETDQSVKTMIGYASENVKQALIDIWGTAGKHFTVQGVVVDLAKGKIVAETPIVSTTEVGSQHIEFTTDEVGADAYFTIVSQSDNTENNRPNIYVETSANHLAANRKLGLVVTGEAGGEVHMWNSSYGPFISGNKRGWTAGDTQYTVSEVGGTSEAVISVASYNSQFQFTSLNHQVYQVADANALYDISSFSSKGPTLDGRTKPDVAAPGWCIVSAASQPAISPTEAVAVTQRNGRSSYYEINGGTSMAAPYVTGSLALWLEANPELSPADILDILRRTAVKDNFTENATPTPNTSWGLGKIDTYEGLYVAAGNETGVLQINATQAQIGYSLSTDGAMLRLLFPQDMGPVNVRIYNSSGSIVLERHIDATHIGLTHQLSLSTLPKGIYIVQTEGMLAKQVFKFGR